MNMPECFIRQYIESITTNPTDLRNKSILTMRDARLMSQSEFYTYIYMYAFKDFLPLVVH